MLTSFVVLAEGGLTWTPETFYIAVTVAQMIIILLTFRVLGLPSEYNTFVNALFVVIPTNAAAFFLKDAGIVGILITGSMLFVLLAMVTRGDVFKSGLAWILTISAYWGLAYFVVPAEDDLYIEQLGGMPYMLMEGGMEAEPLTAEEYEELRGTGGEEDD